VPGLKLFKTDRFEVTDVTCVMVVHFVFGFIASHFHFRCIDDNDVVASINMWCIGDFVLTAQAMRSRCGNIAERLAFCVDNEPFSFYFGVYSILSLARHCRGH